MKNSGSAIIGVLAAATAGIVIGMLIAPQKGEDLRKNVRASVDDWANKLSDMMSEGKEQLAGLKSMFGAEINTLKGEATDLKNEVTESYTNGKA